ncbi:MAG: ATP-dependent metallopeptidase FtsH/Yme1/Tma family protein, partial [Cyclobacteriaceae bacterium]
MKEKEKRDLLKRLRQSNQPSENKNNIKNPMIGMSRIFMFFLLIMFGFFLFSDSGGPQETTWRQFKNDMLEDNEVTKIVVVNKEKAEVYLKEEALQTSEHEDLPSDGLFASDTIPPGPHYYFNIGSVETFESKMDDATADFTEEQMVPISYEERFSIGEDLFAWLIPIGLLILFWVFIARGMRQRGGG